MFLVLDYPVRVVDADVAMRNMADYDARFIDVPAGKHEAKEIENPFGFGEEFRWIVLNGTRIGTTRVGWARNGDILGG